MKRRLFNLLAGVSLVLCALTACVIIRSFVRSDMIEHFTPGVTVGPVLSRSRVRVLFGRGILFVALMDEKDRTTNAADMAKHRRDYEEIPAWGWDIFPPCWPTRVDHHWLGCGYSDYAILNPTGWSSPRNLHGRLVLWFPMLLFAIPPAARLGAGWRRRRQIARGACLHCGYDLRATPARCPECGVVPGEFIVEGLKKSQ